MTARDGLAYECPSQSAITRPEDGMTALCIKHCTHPFVTLHNARPYPPQRYVTLTQLYTTPPPRMWTINSASAVLSRWCRSRVPEKRLGVCLNIIGGKRNILLIQGCINHTCIHSSMGCWAIFGSYRYLPTADGSLVQSDDQFMV